MRFGVDAGHHAACEKMIVLIDSILLYPQASATHQQASHFSMKPQADVC